MSPLLITWKASLVLHTHRFQQSGDKHTVHSPTPTLVALNQLVILSSHSHFSAARKDCALDNNREYGKLGARRHGRLRICTEPDHMHMRDYNSPVNVRLVLALPQQTRVFSSYYQSCEIPQNGVTNLGGHAHCASIRRSSDFLGKYQDESWILLHTEKQSTQSRPTMFASSPARSPISAELSVSDDATKKTKPRQEKKGNDEGLTLFARNTKRSARPPGHSHSLPA